MSRTVTGTEFEVWGQRGWAGFDIVGESFCSVAIQALLGPGALPPEGAEAMAPVHLIHDGMNPHDANCVEVHGSTGLLGRFAREDAARYAPVLSDLQRGGQIAHASARIWGRFQEDWETQKRVFVGSVRLDIPEPHLMVPRNATPTSPHRLLPNGGTTRVSPSDASGTVTERYLCPEGEC